MKFWRPDDPISNSVVVDLYNSNHRTVMKTKTVLVGVILCFASFLTFAQEIQGTVQAILDGNTIEVADHDGVYKVLLHGIDCPEIGQNYADQAKALLTKLLLSKRVTIVLRGKDRLGNRLGVIYVEGFPDPRHELVKEGLAWTSEREPVEELEVLKEQARLHGKGLWKEQHPTPPWVYRRQQTMNQEKSSE
jgi:micrococcal nuclease